MSDAVRIGLLGFGNIGAGVARTLHARRDILAQRLERPLALTRIADVDIKTPRDVGFDYAGLLTDDAAAVLEADDVDVVVELIGGYEPARSFVERALQAGKHVVTANKAMLSKFGPELIATARENGVALLFEASVAGGIPILRSLQQGLAANEFLGVYGILNGTTNFILTRMKDDGASFDEALADAQAKGYAEPDPTFDIEGLDTAHKTAILAWLAFGRPTRGDEVHVEGITQIAPEDLTFAADNGYAIKMLGIARRGDGGALELRAHPAFIPADSMLAAVNGVYNAVMVEGAPVGPSLFYGQGAGPDATSSAVLSDCMALADALADGGLSRESRLLAPACACDMPIAPVADVECAFYLRGGNGPHAARAIIDALEDRDIEIATLHAPEGGATQIVTTVARESALREALASLGADSQPVAIRCLSLAARQ